MTPIPGPNNSKILPAERCESDLVERPSNLAGRKREQVISFLVVSEGRRVESPSNQKIVEISREIICAEPTIDVGGESQQTARPHSPPWQPWNPPAEPPGPNRGAERLGNNCAHKRPVSPASQGQQDSYSAVYNKSDKVVDGNGNKPHAPREEGRVYGGDRGDENRHRYRDGDARNRRISEESR